MEPKQTSFVISRLSRGDFDGSKLEKETFSDEEMEHIAKKMGEAYCTSGAYWSDLAILAEDVIANRE